MVTPRREALIEHLSKHVMEYDDDGALLVTPEIIVEAVYEFDRLRAAERKVENEAARVQRMKAQRDRGRGIYSRWATNASHDDTWCDGDHTWCGYEIAVGERMYMEVDHEHRDPELDVPIVWVFCYDCAINKGIPPVIGGQPKHIYEGAT